MTYTTCNNTFCSNKSIVPIFDHGYDMLFIGEAPGLKETLNKVPFCGKSGQLLRNKIAEASIISFSITNVVKCRPENNRTPTEKEISNCINNLQKDIYTHKFKLILCLGITALKSIIKLFNLSFTPKRYQFYDINQDRKLIYLHHPAFFLYSNSEQIIKFENALKEAKQLLDK